MNKKILAVLVCGSFMLSGCQLNKSLDYISDNETTTTNMQTVENENEIITLQADIVSQIASQYEESKADRNQEPVPDKVLPIDENGEWTDYTLVIVPTHHEFWDPLRNDELGDFGVTFDVANFPVIYHHSENELETYLNNTITTYIQNDYRHRFQMKDLKLDMVCTVMNPESRFLSFEIKGMIYHVGGDHKYQEEKEYRYYFTMDRMTGSIINLDTAMGRENVKNAITEGRYNIIEGEPGIFSRMDNELLARFYIDQPVFPDDISHMRDFYFKDGKLCVCIWVGNENGSYAVLELQDEPDLLLNKDKSIGEIPETDTEEAEETEGEEAGDSIEAETAENDTAEETAENETAEVITEES